MKKFVGILALGLLVLSLVLIKPVFAGKKLKLPEDVVSGTKYHKSLTGKYYQEYGMQVVDKKDGHPVRAGEKSIRFEVRPGDCGKDADGGWNDCKKDRERHELSGKPMSNGTWWYAWSIYIPKDHIFISPSTLIIGQFHQWNNHVIWMFKNGMSREGYYVENQIKEDVFKKQILLEKNDMHGNWNDILVNMNWTHKDDGFFKIWVNDKLSYHYKGPTKTKNDKPYFKFGIYRSHLSKWIKKNKKSEVPAQVVYFDEVRTAKKSCKKLKLEDLGYSCEALESQKTSKIDTPEDFSNNFVAIIKSKDDADYMLKVRGGSKKLTEKKGLKECKKTGNTGCYVHYSNKAAFGQ